MIWRFEIYETLTSTSDTCQYRAEAGECEGLAVLAHRQSAGRGSRGRRWSGGEGNLSFSFLIDLPQDDGFLQSLPFLSGLALYEASVSFIPSCFVRDKAACPPFCLKWPNDLLLNGRKMAGILIETGSDSARRWAVIGIGANVAQAPRVEGRKLAAFSELGKPPAVEHYAREVLAAFDIWRQYRHDNGNQALYAAWLMRAHPVGTCLSVQKQGINLSGRFGGLDRDGRLLLIKENGEILPVITGEIFCV